MEQGFNAQTLSKPLSRVGSAHMPKAPSGPLPGAPAGAPVGGAARTAAHAPQAAAKEDAAINAANKVRGIANLPFMAMLPALPAMGVGAVAGKLKAYRTEAIAGGAADAAMNGIRVTPMLAKEKVLVDGIEKTVIRNPLHLPANMFKLAADKMQAIGKRETEASVERGAKWYGSKLQQSGWEQSLRTKQELWTGRADRLTSKIGETIKPLRSAVSNGLKAMNIHGPVKNALVWIGKRPLGMGIASVAATAGIAAIWLTRSKTNNQGKAALGELTETLGADHPIVHEASKMYSAQKSRSIVNAALQSAGEGVFIAFESSANLDHRAIMPLMMGQFGIGQLNEMLVAESPVLDAFARLNQHEKGEIQAPTAYRAFWISQLVGQMPEAKGNGHGGARNHLVLAIGRDLAERNVPLKEITGLLRDKQQFAALAESVATKMKEAEAAKAAPAAAEAQPHLQAAAPAAKITGAVSHGRVHANNNEIIANDNPTQKSHVERVETAASHTHQSGRH